MAFTSKLAPSLNGAWTRAQRFVADTMRRSARNFEQSMQGRLRGPTGANTLRRRTGALARSIYAKVTATGSTVTLTASGGAGAPYAKIHETGGVVTAKRAKNLAIPLPAAQTAAGVTRLPSPRLDPALKLRVTRAGKKLLGKVTGKGKNAKFTPFYVLKPSVTLPPRLEFRKTWTREVDRLRARMRRGFAVVSKGAK